MLVSVLYFFLLPSSICCMYAVEFIHSPVKGHLVCFLLAWWWIKNKSAINICTQIPFVCKHNFSIHWEVCGGVIIDCINIVCLNVIMDHRFGLYYSLATSCNYLKIFSYKKERKKKKKLPSGLKKWQWNFAFLPKLKDFFFPPSTLEISFHCTFMWLQVKSRVFSYLCVCLSNVFLFSALKFSLSLDLVLFAFLFMFCCFGFHMYLPSCSMRIWIFCLVSITNLEHR